MLNIERAERGQRFGWQKTHCDLASAGDPSTFTGTTVEPVAITEPSTTEGCHLEQPIRAFVHLAYGYGADTWRSHWASGKILGINEPLPYGYFRAEKYGVRVEHSQDYPEGRLLKALRYLIRGVSGLDFVHAWRNRRAMLAAEIVWTHTESQALAVMAVLLWCRVSNPPKVLAQTIWLMDRWKHLSLPKRYLFRFLLSRADMLTFLSPSNLALASSVFRGPRVELALFGIQTDEMTNRPQVGCRNLVRILSVGNDVHRDWATLTTAVREVPGHELKIVTGRNLAKLLHGSANVSVQKATDNREMLAFYDWADLVVVPLKPNLHASGITVILEAIIRGVPVICTDAGGLRSYFRDGEVHYVPPGDPAAIRCAVERLAADPDERSRMVARAQTRLLASRITSQGYARRHAELSREILGRPEISIQD